MYYRHLLSYDVLIQANICGYSRSAILPLDKRLDKGYTLYKIFVMKVRMNFQLLILLQSVSKQVYLQSDFNISLT